MYEDLLFYHRRVVISVDLYNTNPSMQCTQVIGLGHQLLGTIRLTSISIWNIDYICSAGTFTETAKLVKI